MKSQNLTPLQSVINARGTFTPLGVSRSSSAVCHAVSDALSRFYIMDELHSAAAEAAARYAGAEAAMITHCTSAAITITVAATMTGTAAEKIAALPETTGMAHHVLIPAPHCVNYGQSILQAVRLSGATPVVVGTEAGCSLTELEEKLTETDACCLLLVSSKLVSVDTLDLQAAVDAAHRHGIPAIIDGAAQDFRATALVRTCADAVLLSAQKYLAAATAGIVVGNKALVAAARAQEKGIGRGMKATKEALAAVSAAIAERELLGVAAWQEAQQRKVAYFMDRAGRITGITAQEEADPTGLPLKRVFLSLDEEHLHCSARTLAAELKAATPAVWVIDQDASAGRLGFELVPLSEEEMECIVQKIEAILREKSSFPRSSA